MDRYAIWAGVGFVTLASFAYLWQEPVTEALVVEDGKLTLSSLVKLLKTLRQAIAETLAPGKTDFKHHRMEDLRAKTNSKLVQSHMQTQLSTVEQVCMKTLLEFKVSPEVFDRSLAAYAKHPSVVALTDCLKPCSPPAQEAYEAPVDLDLKSLVAILQKRHSMLLNELKLKRMLSSSDIAALQASISDNILTEFGVDDKQVSQASASNEANLIVRRLTSRIRHLQKRLLVAKHRLSKSI